MEATEKEQLDGMLRIIELENLDITPIVIFMGLNKKEFIEKWKGYSFTEEEMKKLHHGFFITVKEHKRINNTD